MVEAALEFLISNLSYLGVFLSSVITSASIIFPLPGQLIVPFAVVLKLNPYLTAVVAGAGSMLGELTGYALGVVGGKAMKKKLEDSTKLVKIVRKHFHKHALWVIFVTSFIFFPFDIVGIMSGLDRYDVRKFLIAGFIGKFLKVLALFFLIQNGIHVFGLDRVFGL